VLVPFLDQAIGQGAGREFSHTQTPLNARFITKDLAERMVTKQDSRLSISDLKASPAQWQQGTGGKVYSEELAAAFTTCWRRVLIPPT